MDAFSNTSELASAPLAATPKSGNGTQPLARPQHSVVPRYPALFQVDRTSVSGSACSPKPLATLSLADLNTHAPLMPPPQPGPRISASDVSECEPGLKVPPPAIPYPSSLMSSRRDHSEGSCLDEAPANKRSGNFCLWQSTPTCATKQSEQNFEVLRARYPSQNPMIVAKWNALLEALGTNSSLFVELETSEHRWLHRNRVLDGLAPSTALRYISTALNFLRVCQESDVSLASLTDVKLADLLLIINLGRASDAAGVSCASTLKALRWLYKHAGVMSLECANSTLAQSFLSQKIPKDKREAPPLPLWVLVQWERRILQSTSSNLEVLILGSFLFMVFSGLRFADLQRVNLHSLVFTPTEVRGTCWRSKISVHGHPFGVVCSGFLSRGSHTWLWKFLSVLDTFLDECRPQTPDFLLPACSLQEILEPYRAMSYAAALRYLRYFLHCPWRSSQSPILGLEINFTIHSLKATLLSWGPQVGAAVTDAERLRQGHHQDLNSSLELYGRDSVWSALRYQHALVAEVHKGFRPKIPQHRGAQCPLVEPTVVLEQFKKDIPTFDFQWFDFQQQTPNAQPETLEDDLVDEVLSIAASTSSAASSSTSSCCSQPPPSKRRAHSPDEETHLLLAHTRGVVHAMVPTSDRHYWRPMREGQRLKPACGRMMRESQATFLVDLDPALEFCQHPGCRKIWQNLD